MTFDDGILKIYRLENTAQKGDMPNEQLVYKSSFYFGFDNLGISRYYTALSHNQRIESVVNIEFDTDVRVLDIVEMEDGSYFKIQMLQREKDDDGLIYLKLSLERLNDEFDKQTEEN